MMTQGDILKCFGFEKTRIVFRKNPGPEIYFFPNPCLNSLSLYDIPILDLMIKNGELKFVYPERRINQHSLDVFLSGDNGGFILEPVEGKVLS